MDRQEMTGPVRVAHIIGTLPGGGVKNVTFNYYRQIDKDRFQFDFYYDSQQEVELPQEIIDMGARFYRIPNHKHVLKCLGELRKHFRENRYQIVHSGMNSLSFVSLYAAKKENVKVRIVHNHSVPGGSETLKNLIKNILRSLSVRYANARFACSYKAADWMYGSHEGVYIMRNAVDFDRFQKPDPKLVEEIRKRYDLKDRFVVGTIGRLTFAKNHRFLIEIFKKLKEKRKDAVLLIVGDGEMKEEIKGYVADSGLADSIIMTGNVDKTELYYHVMNVTVNPSVFEGLSLVTIESQISGTPVVISENIPEEAVLCDKGLKKLSLNDTPETWANSILELEDKKVLLNEKAQEYRIEKETADLEKQYDLLLNR